MDSQEKNKVKSIQRAFTIIRTISKFNDHGLRLSQIAKKTDLHIATTRRLLHTLISEEFIMYDTTIKKYFIGGQIYKISSSNEYSQLSSKYHGVLEKLTKMTGDTSYLSCRIGFDILCIDTVEGYNPIRVVYEVGERWPIGIGSAGIAILGAIPLDEVEDILAANESRYFSGNVKIDLKRIKNYLEFSREMGFSFCENLHLVGSNTVGIPIKNSQNKIIGAISVTSISERMPFKKAMEIVEEIKPEIELIKPANLFL